MSVTLPVAWTMFLDRPNIKEVTRSKYFYRLDPFMIQFISSFVDELETSHLAEYINGKSHLADPSKSIIRAAFHAFFNFCIEQGWISNNPAKGLPRWSDVPKYVHVPSDAEVGRALAMSVMMCKRDDPLSLRDGLVFMLAVYSGCRRGELRNLDVGDLDRALQNPIGQSYRAYTKGKTGEAVLRFSEFHKPYIEKYLQVRPNFASTAVFVSLDQNSRDYGKKLSLTTFNRIRRKVCERAKVPSITYQELRRRLATFVARSEGVDVAAHTLGHSPHSGDRVIRLFYYDPDVEKVDAAAEKAFNGITK